MEGDAGPVPADRRGRFVVLEGVEGSGKSTQAALLATRLGAVLTREPGGTEVGERIRRMLLDPGLAELDARAETLLLLAARAQHVAQVIRPTLAAGRHVVCDRFAGSTLAYQGFGRGLDHDELARLSHWSTAGLAPDRVVLLDLAAGEAAARLARRGNVPDRVEAETAAFFARVRSGFATQAAADRTAWRVVDGAGAVDTVGERVFAAVADLVRNDADRGSSGF